MSKDGAVRNIIRQFEEQAEILAQTVWSRAGDDWLRELSRKAKEHGYDGDLYAELEVPEEDIVDPSYDCHICGQPGGH